MATLAVHRRGFTGTMLEFVLKATRRTASAIISPRAGGYVGHITSETDNLHENSHSTASLVVQNYENVWNQ